MSDYAEIYARLEAYRPPPGAYKPLMVSFSMATPISLGHPWINGDALLAAQLFRDVIGDLWYALPSKRVLPLDDHITMPLTRSYQTVVSGGVYHASASILDTDTVRMTTAYGRFDTEHANLIGPEVRKKKIQLGSGFYKAGLVRRAYTPANTVVFYFHGHEGEVRRLLQAVTHLGKDRGSGYGEVHSVRVNEIEHDMSIEANGMIMRPIPYECVPWASPTQCAQLTYRPPYWDRSRATMCVPPGTMRPADYFDAVDSLGMVA